MIIERTSPQLALDDREQETLEQWIPRPKSAQALARRARIILSCADGLANTVVAAQSGVSKPTVGKWRPRFLAQRLDCRNDGRPVPRQPYLPVWRQLVFPVHLLGLAPLLGSVGAVAGDVKLQDHGVVDHPVDGRGRGHGVGTVTLPLGDGQARGDAQGPALVAFVEEQEVEVVQFAQPTGQIQVALGEEKFLHQTVGWDEEDGVAGCPPAVAQGAEGVGVAGAGWSKGGDIDAAFDELALGQMVQLLAQGQGRSVILEGFPGLARGQPGLPAQPVDAPLLPILSLLFQHLRQRERQEGGQGTAMASGGEA